MYKDRSPLFSLVYHLSIVGENSRRTSRWAPLLVLYPHVYALHLRPVNIECCTSSRICMQPFHGNLFFVCCSSTSQALTPYPLPPSYTLTGKVVATGGDDGKIVLSLAAGNELCVLPKRRSEPVVSPTPLSPFRHPFVQYFHKRTLLFQ